MPCPDYIYSINKNGTVSFDTDPRKLVECPAHLTSASDGIFDWASSSFIATSFKCGYISSQLL